MSISTRLILLLTVVVGVVMAVASVVILRQREAVLQTALRNELRAHAFTLQIALEEYYGSGRAQDAQWFIDHLSDNPKVYGVVLFDKDGKVRMLSDPLIPEEIHYPDQVREVIATGSTAEMVHIIGDEEVFSIIMPIRASGVRLGAFEIAQPMSYVKADIGKARQQMAVMALLLMAAIFLVVLFVTRQNLARPIKELVGGAAAIGRGDLDYRVIVPSRGGEFGRLARDFNRMADHLAEQRRVAAREAEERLGLERALRHSERLATIGRIASGVAHEIGAPLNVIYARAGQLLASPEAPLHTRQRHISIIRAQAERITRIVQQLLNLAHPAQLRTAPVDLSAAATAVLDLVEADAARRGIKVETQFADNVVVEADKSAVQQVLSNLYVNAIQAMTEGGRLVVTCKADNVERDGRLYAALQVLDTGTGIAAEHVPHIFEPFYTTKEVGSGTGLGLAVSSRIMQEHGGWIEVDNNESGGAVFTLYFPRSSSPASEDEHDERSERVDRNESATTSSGG
jgi:signal transduction histidine kinase